MLPKGATQHTVVESYHRARFSSCHNNLGCSSFRLNSLLGCEDKTTLDHLNEVAVTLVLVYRNTVMDALKTKTLNSIYI